MTCRWITALLPLMWGVWVAHAPAQEAEEKKEEADDTKIVDMPEDELEAEIDRVMSRVEGRIEKVDFPAMELERRKRAVRGLAALPHPKTLDALTKLVKSKNDPEVRAAAAEAMGHMKFAKKDAGKFLVGRIKKDWKVNPVLIGIARGLGELGVVPDRDAMYDYFKHPDDAVYVSMIECLGTIGDVADLDKLHEIFSQYRRQSVAGVSVRVDTGAAGSKDANAARAKGASMQRRARSDRREGGLHAVQQAAKHITGEQFETADDLWGWMVEHEADLGLKLSKSKKKQLAKEKERFEKEKAEAERKAKEEEEKKKKGGR